MTRGAGPDPPDGDAPTAEPSRPGLAALLARGLVAGRWWVVGFWAVITLGSLTVFPSFGEVDGGGLKGIVAADTPAVQTERRSVEIFGYPLIARTVVVQRDPDGMSPYAQARSLVRAVAVNRGKAGKVDPILGALPVTNSEFLFPDAKEQDTAALTYLLFGPDSTLGQRTRAAQRYADRFFGERDAVVGVTGSVPARAVQGDLIDDALPGVEAATLLAIVLIVGLSFRSLVAPVVTVVTAGVAFVATLRISGVAAEVFDLPSPEELEPVVVALLLGVVTDYVVFFCSALREVPGSREDTRALVTRAITRSGPIVAVAGLAVAGGTATLLAAESPFFRALGPALAFTVTVGLLVAITLVPALMALLGDWLLWPGGLRRPRSDGPGWLLRVLPGTAGGARRPWWTRVPTPTRLVERIVRRRSVAALTAGTGVTVLVLAASPVLGMQLGVSFVSALPSQTQVRTVAESAQAGFAAGILSPTVVQIEGESLDEQPRALARLAGFLSDQPGVAGVLGPGRQAVVTAAETRANLGLFLSDDGNAARYLVVLDEDPLSAAAVGVVDGIQDELPDMLDASGLSGVEVGLGGDSATASHLVHQTEGDLLRIAVAAMAANLLMLLLFLRALVASVLLLATSLLSLSATLGLTTVFFEWLDPGLGLTFYVPFATAVLLLAFGSDYNIFTVGHVWEAARRQPLRLAMTTTLPASIRAVAIAGAALAASFGLLVLVPLAPFRQLAFGITLGLLIDVFVVRALLVPALLSLVGPKVAWPSRQLRVTLGGATGRRATGRRQT